jgi:MYXO-CTERM domain-containing protein
MPKRIIATLGAALALAAAQPATAAILSVGYGTATLANPTANLITNGSFETGAAGNQNWTGPGPHTGPSPPGSPVTIPSWNAAYPTGAYGWWGPITFAGAPCGEATNCVYFGNWTMSASATPTTLSNGVVLFGGPVTFTNTAPNFANQGPVTLSQTVSLTVGETYLLDFWTSGEEVGGAPGVFGLTIGSNHIYLEAVEAARRYYVSFSPSTAATTITFSNWGHLVQNSVIGTELVLDDVILNATTTPEPASALLLPLALAALARRRRTA